MKILLSSYHNPHFITITEYIEFAIRKLNHELIRFDDRQHLVPGRIRNRIKFLERFDLQNINRKFISLALDTKPDLVIVAGGHRIQAKSIKILNDYNIKTVLWTIDAPVNFNPIISVANFYDHVFCGGTEAQEIFKKKGIWKTNWLPFGCAPEFHRPVTLSSKEKMRYKKDIVFVGSFYPNRWQILKELKEFEIGIWGPNWAKVNNASSDRFSIHSVQLKHKEWTKIFAAAKIVLILHFNDGKTLCYQASPKVYEALACNSFALVDKQKDVFSLFENKKHLVSFDNISDLKKKIIYYLQNAKEREKIAASGYKEVLKKHTYIHRIRHILSIINA